jgi:hypothetical protein
LGDDTQDHVAVVFIHPEPFRALGIADRGEAALGGLPLAELHPSLLEHFDRGGLGVSLGCLEHGGEMESHPRIARDAVAKHVDLARPNDILDGVEPRPVSRVDLGELREGVLAFLALGGGFPEVDALGLQVTRHGECPTGGLEVGRCERNRPLNLPCLLLFLEPLDVGFRLSLSTPTRRTPWVFVYRRLLRNSSYVGFCLVSCLVLIPVLLCVWSFGTVPAGIGNGIGRSLSWSKGSNRIFLVAQYY